MKPAIASPEAAMARALQAMGRDFGGALPASKPAPADPAPTRRSIQEGDILLGRASNGDEIGINLGKLIEGRLLIQGNSGAGKSMLLRRIFEQSFGRVQQLLLDPDGEFSTLAENLDVAVMSSVDIQRVGGQQFALNLRQHRFSAVVDFSDAKSEERLAIATEIIEGLIQAPSEFWFPLLVLVDEAQTFAPHYDTGDVDSETRKRAIAAMADMMGRGRKRGVAGVIATQRLAETSKAVASKATNVAIGRTVFDRDLERAGALLGFTVGHSRALRTLADGEFLALGPALNLPGRSRFKAGPVRSTHKGKAPTIEQPPTITAANVVEILKGVPAAADTFVPPARTDNRGTGRYWTAEEDAIVREGYENTTRLHDIAKQLADAGFRHRSIGTISMRASALGCRSNSPSAKGGWSPAEDEILIAAYADKDVKIMDIVGMLTAAGFDRGRVSVQMRAIALGITRDRVNYYTDEETAIAKAGLEAGKSSSEILTDLRNAGFHRGVTSIYKFAQKHGYNRKSDPWTPDQIAELKRLYELKKPTKEIAEQLGKPVSGIAAKASKLGLKQRVGWTEIEFETLRAASEDGKSLGEAAELIGRPYPNVARMAAQLNLSFKADRKVAQ